MMKPAEFLKKYDTILFDMDGVITSEQNYWITAALSVYEMLFGCSQGNIATLMKSRCDIRNLVFCSDKTIILLKELGINTNWDLTYVVFCVAKSVYLADASISKATLFQKVYEYLCQIKEKVPVLYDIIAKKFSSASGLDLSYCKREGAIWQSCRRVFQQWYMGDEVFVSIYGEDTFDIKGKSGLLYDEQPLIEINRLDMILSILFNAGYRLGAGTGRQSVEIAAPIRLWDLSKYFDESIFITYSDVALGQENLKKMGIVAELSKPHPYMFLKGVFGKDYDDYKIYVGDYDKKCLKRVLVIGDAGSDIYAAKAAGIDFAAVLTGVAGEKSRKYFEDMSAEHILDSIEALTEDE